MLKKFIIIFITLGIILMPYSFDFSVLQFACAETPASGVIHEGDRWIKANSPYIILGGILINDNGTLIIDPGVVVKLGKNAGIRVEGKLIVNGGENDPVIFTSIYDDEAGEEDNSDWSDQPPQPGDWKAIHAYEDSEVDLSYAVVRYGGFEEIFLERNNNKILAPNNAYAQEAWGEDMGAILVSGEAKVNIDNSVIANNTIGLEARESWNEEFIPILNIHNSEIHNNQLAGIINYNDNIQVDAVNNWWGHDSEPSHLLNFTHPFNEPGYDIYGDVLFDPWIGKEKEKDPVIIVPGIGACINLKVLIDSEASSYDWKLMGHYYDGIIQTFEAADFELNKNLFVGCYDWRKTNGLDSDAVVNSGEEYLKYWIDKAKQEAGAEKVDIVAHSMGGLISRSYIQGDNYRDDVDQLIMLGTPNHGSSEAYYLWEGGEVPSYWGLVEKMILKIYLNILKIKGYNITNIATIQEFIPSLKQLLPTYDYIFDEETRQLILAHLMIENNNWLRNLNQEAEINKLKDRVGINIIYGNGEPTLNTIAVLPRTNLDIQFNRWIDGRPDPDITDYKSNGDKTVTADSAILNGIESYALENIKHSQLPDQAGLKILELLEIDSDQAFSSPDIDDSLVIIVASPVFPMITAPDNESKIGYDIEAQSVINNIANAQYFSAGDQDVKLIIIPNPEVGEYKIELIGNGNGKYNLASGYFSEEQSVIKEISGVIIAGQAINYQVELQPDNEESPISDLVTIDSTIADIEEMYENGWITKKSSKNLLIRRLKTLQKRLDIFAKQKSNIEKLKQKILDNTRIKEKHKQKLLNKFDKRLQKLEQQKDKFIKKSLDKFKKILDKFYSKEVINQQGYDIIISNINYLRQNL